MAFDATVLGGGVAGLVVARRLARGGASVVVVEQSDRFGGQVAPLRIAGVELDAAAESFATRGGTVAALATELGLADDLVSPSPAPAWLHRADGSAVPLPAAGLLGIPGHPLAGDVVRAIGRPAAWRAAFDGVLPRSVGRDASSLGALVRARMGRGVLDGLVAPIVRGVHSTEPDALAVEAASPLLRAGLAERGSLAAAVRALRAQAPAGSQVGGIRGGMHRLVAALVADCERLGVDLHLGAHPRDTGGLVIRAHSETPPDARRLTLVTLVVEAPALDAAPRGTGLLVAADAPGVSARALTHLSAKWAWIGEALPGRHALRLSYDAEPADAVETARADAEALLDVRFDGVTDAATRVWVRGARAPRETGIAVGEGVAGTGLASVVAQAERVAAEVLAGH